MSAREELATMILNRRPTLKENTVKTYVSLLASLLTKMGDNMHHTHLFSNPKAVLDYLSDVSPNKRKTTLSALYILTGIPAYHTLMVQDCNTVNKQNSEQNKSAKQEENWVEWPVVCNKYETMKKMAVSMLNDRKERHIFEQRAREKFLVLFFIMALMSGAGGVPPRRSLDYTELKVRNYDPSTDNYYADGKLYFNKYKTANVYGLTVIDVSKELNGLIKKWIKIDPTDWLLFGSTQHKLNPQQIVVYNNEIWDGKHVSVDMYRHIYLTQFYSGKTPTYADIEKVSRAMGHSVKQSLLYSKKE
jgi:hypothetical protein